MLATCPKCGCDLEALRTFEAGKLRIDDGALVSWGGERVPLPPCERLICIALARASGAPVKRWVLAEAAGYEGEHADNFVAVLINRMTKRFRQVDPGFDAIESIRGAGLRWRTA